MKTSELITYLWENLNTFGDLEVFCGNYDHDYGWRMEPVIEVSTDSYDEVYDEYSSKDGFFIRAE